MDKSASSAAHQIGEQLKVEEEIAAVRMQSLYRGFRDRKQVRHTREHAEEELREQKAEALQKMADHVSKDHQAQTAFTTGEIA